MKYKVPRFWGDLHPNLPYAQKRDIFFKNLYQDLCGVTRMLHHKSIPLVDCAMLAVQT